MIQNLVKNITFFIRNRFIIFSLFLILFILVQYFSFGSFLPSSDTKDLWFYSGVFMALFSILFIEPYYSSPKNVITNAIPLLLLLLPIKSSFSNLNFWWGAIGILLSLLIASVIAMTLEDNNQSPLHWKNTTSRIIKNIVVHIGQGKILYSAVFFYFLLTYYSIQNFYTVILFALWAAILSIDPKSLHNKFSLTEKKKNKDQIGNIFSVQANSIFLANLYDDKKNISKFDLVKFTHSMQLNDHDVITGIIFDTFLLNQERWVKILQLNKHRDETLKLEKNAVYKISHQKELDQIIVELKINNFVGIVIEGSTIGKVKFEYSKMKDDLQEGDLLELKLNDKRLFYQVIAGNTENERIKDRNEIGFIEGEATQLGEWQNDKLSFQKFGWVPQINTPLFKADSSDIKVDNFAYPYFQLGVIPGTSLPSIIDLDKAVSHHIALLGITGSGKSYLARKIIEEIKQDTKIICVDFNKEFVRELKPMPPNIIERSKESSIAKNINWLNNELEKFGNQQDKTEIEKKQSEIKKIMGDEVKNFLDDTACNIKIFELADLSNTSSILDYTKYFFQILFEIAKERQITNCPSKICVVLEEAHTIIPEWNFAGTSDKSSQSLVNSIGQIALQGRKYGIGFLVIAQRTANVSKTILTQCNTVICFQAFDETSFSFLGNYVGKEMVQALPNLKQYHAIIAGKAIKSNMPMIIQLNK